MAATFLEKKLYVSNIEYKKTKNGKYFITADGAFMSAHQNENKEWVNDDPLFTNVISFNKEVNTLLKEIKNSKKGAGFIVINGKMATKISEGKDGKKYYSNSLNIFTAKSVERKDINTEAVEIADAQTITDEEIPF